MDRLTQLLEISAKLEPDKRTAVEPLLTDIVFMESRLAELRKLPHIRIHPRNPERQQITAAGKQYKETMQSYLNALKVILTAINRQESDAAAELLDKLKEFE